MPDNASAGWKAVTNTKSRCLNGLYMPGFEGFPPIVTHISIRRFFHSLKVTVFVCSFSLLVRIFLSSVAVSILVIRALSETGRIMVIWVTWVRMGTRAWTMKRLVYNG